MNHRHPGPGTCWHACAVAAAGHSDMIAVWATVLAVLLAAAVLAARLVIIPRGRHAAPRSTRAPIPVAALLGRGPWLAPVLAAAVSVPPGPADE